MCMKLSKNMMLFCYLNVQWTLGDFNIESNKTSWIKSSFFDICLCCCCFSTVTVPLCECFRFPRIIHLRWILLRCGYSCVQRLLWAGNQGRPILATQKTLTCFHGYEAKKESEFFRTANSQYFFWKISWIDPWVSRINWCSWKNSYLANKN